MRNALCKGICVCVCTVEFYSKYFTLSFILSKDYTVKKAIVVDDNAELMWIHCDMRNEGISLLHVHIQNISLPSS